jgi:pyruvate dehydrogenase E2 component (dihydrolipoamide acetyltransferase)
VTQLALAGAIAYARWVIMKPAKQSSWRKLALSTWSRPHDPSVYGWLELDVSRALAYLARVEQTTAVKVTLTHLIGKALAVALARYPDANARVARGRIVAHDSVDIFFQVAYERGDNLSGATIRGVDRKSLAHIARELTERAAAIRSHKTHDLARSDRRMSRVPASLRRVAVRLVETAVYDVGLRASWFGLPEEAFGSAMVTNVGMFGLPHGLAPLVPFARVPIVLTVGSMHDAVVADGGAAVVRPVVAVGVTLDHRVLDGALAGRLAAAFREVMLDPARALEPATEGS